MLLRGGKIVETRENFFFFLQDSNFQLLFTVMLYVKMFVTFTYLFFFVDVDLRSVCVCGLFLDSVCIGRYGMRFDECFEKSLYGRNLLLTIQNLSLLPRDIGFSTNEGMIIGCLGTANV